MSSATIYKMNKKGYLLHSDVKAVSGFRVATDPFIQISEDKADANTLAEAIRASLCNDDTIRVPDPKDWKEHSKEYLRKTGLKSLKELDKATTLCCGLERRNNSIFFTPTKHAEKPDRGFLHKSREDGLEISVRTSDEDIVLALELAFSRCE